uniref:BTB domain-containing protein n=1 Tax=Panagrolaimus davidi TaxID=227884 RepID=A0A914P6G4_9BILA
MASSSSKTMFEYSINLEWTIAEDRLKALKDSTNNKFLESEKFIAFHSSDVQYSLIIYPNGYNEKRGKTWIFFNLELGNAKKIEADFTLSIKSAEWRHEYTFEKSVACGNTCCTVAELFDSRKKFIVDGKFTLKVKGILKIETLKTINGMNILQSKKKTIKNFGDLWDAGFEDFTFVAEGKEIKVHKNVLACQSPVFATMFKSSAMKEAIESKVEIPDFPFGIVQKALKFCYKQIDIVNLTMNDSFLLLKFSDKYDISLLHVMISLFTLCKLVMFKFLGIFGKIFER